jgi:thiamine biosynthesis lipoprotein
VKTTLFVLSLLIVALTPLRTAAAPREVREVHYQMGTFLEMTLWHPEVETAKRLVRDAVAEVHRLEEILSNYDPDSALSRLNRHAGAGPMQVPAELFEVLARACEFSARTSGIFDITIGSLMELWRKAEEEKLLPKQMQLSEALAAVGYRHLRLHADKAELLHKGTRIDLGGIGKGYAVDRVAQRLRAAGVSAALINFGGSSMIAIGAPPGKAGWEIALQDADGRLRGLIFLRDSALSTSGSMGRFWTIDGKRYGHLINPISGTPITEARMATVVSRSATEAEALTKPLILLGKSALLTMKEFPGAEAIVIPETGAPAFSQHFPSVASWKSLPAQ